MIKNYVTPKVEKEKKSIIVRSPIKEKVVSKIVTSDSVKPFLKNALSKYSGIFENDSRITKVFNENNIFSDNQIPNKKKDLMELKGIGDGYAKKILKKLKDKTNE